MTFPAFMFFGMQQRKAAFEPACCLQQAGCSEGNEGSASREADRPLEGTADLIAVGGRAGERIGASALSASPVK